MEDLRSPLRPHVTGLIAAAREAAAAPFHPESLRTSIMAWAKMGFEEFRVYPLHTIDVTKSAAVKAGLAYLTREGFEHRWETIPLPADTVLNPARATGYYSVLVIGFPPPR